MDVLLRRQNSAGAEQQQVFLMGIRSVAFPLSHGLLSFRRLIRRADVRRHER